LKNKFFRQNFFKHFGNHAEILIKVKLSKLCGYRFTICLFAFKRAFSFNFAAISVKPFIFPILITFNNAIIYIAA